MKKVGNLLEKDTTQRRKGAKDAKEDERGALDLLGGASYYVVITAVFAMYASLRSASARKLLYLTSLRDIVKAKSGLYIRHKLCHMHNVMCHLS